MPTIDNKLIKYGLIVLLLPLIISVFEIGTRIVFNGGQIIGTFLRIIYEI